MERCLLMKQFFVLRAVRFPYGLPSPLLKSFSPSFFPPSLARGCLKVLAAEDNGLHWQPAFRLGQPELMEDAPTLLRTCGDFDWKAHANELRALAELSLLESSTNNQPSSFKSKDAGEGIDKNEGYTGFGAALALATAMLFQFGLQFSALAEEMSAQKTEVSEAAARAPAWLTPTLLAFPVVSYAIFYVYRSQVNPNAKVTDWMFGVAATVIIANLILISTIGVRLY
ncbi:hypothetical protein KP509_38G036500 [Ceratopteris richardii]|uniref:Uncharacterized protein n=1 Tax=Ceratopteris richardii TaxID=49495 RepID=A0A8T2Q407_CERRI|nr:hypothetical protein KP509_38G036500 [Ceratopteris richardii]KAH7278334.1 hypothetical protein KP509_38G036500 [Ceratopteris richardii]